jgi:hypothetical protein
MKRVAAVVVFSAGLAWAARPDAAVLSRVAVDYPEEGSVFPPEIAAPTFLWRDAAENARAWLIEVTFADSLVFARAEGKDAYPEGRKIAEYANDPNETEMQYDLYRLPFNGGQGGQAEPIAGASRNGKSNSFPRVSPDGRWIVFVQARNGLLMRPDSQLYIVPAAGGVARRMRANTPLMNSWHSFSPNGRWLVFSSKGRSPYTQMYLTHLDEAGNDSPAILIEGSTAANRAASSGVGSPAAGRGVENEDRYVRTEGALPGEMTTFSRARPAPVPTACRRSASVPTPRSCWSFPPERSVAFRLRRGSRSAWSSTCRPPPARSNIRPASRHGVP